VRFTISVCLTYCRASLRSLWRAFTEFASIPKSNWTKQSMETKVQSPKRSYTKGTIELSSAPWRWSFVKHELPAAQSTWSPVKRWVIVEESEVWVYGKCPSNELSNDSVML
jgi:hypothetical protein